MVNLTCCPDLSVLLWLIYLLSRSEGSLVIDFLVVLSLFIGGFPVGVICCYDYGLLLFPLGFTIYGKTVSQFSLTEIKS